MPRLAALRRRCTPSGFAWPFLLAAWGTTACLPHRPPKEPLVFEGPKTTSLPLWRSDPASPKIYVEATLADGVPRLFMVDTGADFTMVHADVAAAAGLTVREQRGTVAGIGGSIERWQVAEGVELHLGPTTLRDLFVGVGVPGVPTHTGIVPVAGIIGSDVWQHFHVTIDYPANRMELRHPDVAPPEALAVPLFRHGGHIQVAVNLLVDDPSAADGIRRQPWVLELDTGALGVLLAGRPDNLDPAVPARSTVGIEPLFGIGSDDQLPVTAMLRETRHLPLKGLELGPMVVREEFDARWIDAPPGRSRLPPDMPGLLGHEVFDEHRLVIDFPRSRLSLLPPKGPATFRDAHAWAYAQNKRPKTAEDVYQKALLLARLDKMDDARALLTRALKHEDAPNLTVLLSAVLRAEEDIQGADALLATLSAGALVDEHAIITATNSRWLQGDTEGALRIAEAAIRERPEAAEAWIALADAQTSAGNHAAARLALETANELDEDPDGQLLRRAWVATQEGDVAAALTHFRRRLSIFPSGPYTPWIYASVARAAGLPDLAKHDLDVALSRLHPGDGPLDFMASAYRLLDAPEAAAQSFTDGFARDCGKGSDANQANCSAWYAGLAGKDLDAAAQDIARALDAEPHSAQYLDTLAVVYESRGMLDDAHNAAVRAALRDPKDVYLLWQARRLGQAVSSSP